MNLLSRGATWHSQVGTVSLEGLREELLPQEVSDRAAPSQAFSHGHGRSTHRSELLNTVKDYSAGVGYSTPAV